MPVPIRYGGELPAVRYGLQLTVEAPDGTSESTPVNQYDIYKLALAADTASDGSGYKLVDATSGDDAADSIWVRANHRQTTVGPMGVTVVGKYTNVLRLSYVSGAAPTLGQSVAPSATDATKVAGIAFDGTNAVLKIDTAQLLVDVIF